MTEKISPDAVGDNEEVIGVFEVPAREVVEPGGALVEFRPQAEKTVRTNSIVKAVEIQVILVRIFKLETERIA